MVAEIVMQLNVLRVCCREGVQKENENKRVFHLRKFEVIKLKVYKVVKFVKKKDFTSIFPADFADCRRFELKGYKVCKVYKEKRLLKLKGCKVIGGFNCSIAQLLNSVYTPRLSAKFAGNIIPACSLTLLAHCLF